MDIGWVGKGKGPTTWTSWNGYRKGKGKNYKGKSKGNYKGAGKGFGKNYEGKGYGYGKKGFKGKEKEKDSTTKAKEKEEEQATQAKEKAQDSTETVTTTDLSLWRLAQSTQKKIRGLQEKKIGGPKRKNTTKVTLIGLMTPTIGGLTITAL